MRGDGPDWLDAEGGGYTFLVLAAHDARKASRRYWASGSWADQRYPAQPVPWWSQAPDPDEIPDSQPTTRRGRPG